jgi:hypothetical protein
MRLYSDATIEADWFIDRSASTINFRTVQLKPLVFATNNAERMRIGSGGSVGINTTNPLQRLHVSGGNMLIENTYALYLNGSDTNWGFGRNIVTDSGFLTSNTVQVKVFNGATQGFQVVNSGNTAIFEVEGSTGRARVLGGLAVGNITPSATAGRIDASNDIVAYSTSDSRLKENVTPIENALEKVKALTGVEFDWKEETKEVHGYEGHVGHVVNFARVWSGPERLIRELETRIKSDFFQHTVTGTDGFRYEWINETVDFDSIVRWVDWEVKNTFIGIVPVTQQ